MLRVYFLNHRELLGELSRAAYETVKELMGETALEEEHFRPGMVSVVRTFGDQARFHPHVPVRFVCGGWNGCEQVPVAYLDTPKAEGLFRHRVFSSLLVCLATDSLIVASPGAFIMTTAVLFFDSTVGGRGAGGQQTT